MPTSFRALFGAFAWLVIGIALATGTVPAWAQKMADRYPGFEVDLVYRAPDIEHPSAVTCDDEGNLFLGEDPMDMRGPATKEIDRIVLIRFDKRTGAPVKTVFCQNLSSVFGLLWDDGALYVMHAPHYSVFRDTDGDGVADERKDLAQGFGPPAGKHGFNDHIVTGIRLGLDRRVYVSVGDKGIQHAVGSDGSTLTLEGGGIVSMRLDGSQLEVVSSGTRNHLDVAMDSLDNIFTYDNTDDGLGWWTRFTHQVPTGYYGYPYEHLKHPERHLPRISEHGGGSPCGAACYRGATWPEKYRDNVFYCEWGKSKVQRFIPTRSGATFTATMDDFLVRAGNEEFRPLDLCFSPDGRSMFVADWNVEVWTNLQVRGRLFRVRYVGTDVPAEPPRVSDDAPLGAQLKALGHRSDSERARAQVCLARLGQPAIAPVTALLASADASKLAKVHALWTLNDIANRLPAYDPARAWIAALDDRDADVRSQAARALGQRRSRAATSRLVAAMGDEDAQVRMWAAIALGRIGDPSTAPILYRALADVDAFARFVAIQAIRALNQWQPARQLLASDDSQVRLAMLVALTGAYDDTAVDALIWSATENPDLSLRVQALQSLAEVHRRADPYTEGWWGIQPAAGKPARTKHHEWSATGRVMATLRGALAAQDPQVRAAALAALVEIHDVESAPLLAQIAADPKSALPLRIAAIGGLAKLGGPGSGDALTKILGDDSLADDLELAALEAVGKLKVESALPAVRRLLAADEAEIRAQAIQSLAEIRGAAAADEIVHAFADAEPEVRIAAIRSAGELELRAAVDRLIALVADPHARDEAMLALAEMPDRRALSIYLDGLLHKSPKVRGASRAALKALRDTIGRDIIERNQRGELSGILRVELQPIFNAPKPITTWQIVGTWPRMDPPDLDSATIPNLTEPWVAAGRPFAWHQITTARPDGEVRLNGELPQDEDVCALAYATLESDQDCTTLMQLGCGGEGVVWVNGTQVGRIKGDHTWNPAGFQNQVELKKGTNHIWLRTSSYTGSWSFSLALGAQDPDFKFLYENVPTTLDARAYRDFAISHPGNPARGREIFADLKGVGCIKCHAVGGVGAKIGPDLTGIGTRYPRAELIRSVLEPSNRVAAGYLVTTIVTDAGKIYSGIVKTDSQDVVELVDIEGRVISIATGDIEERNLSNLSLMPSGLKDGLTPEAFADVIAYLESLK